MVCNIDEQTCELDTGKHMTGSLYIELIIFVNKLFTSLITLQLLFIAVLAAHSAESVRTCIDVILHLFLTIFLSNFETVPTVWYFLPHILLYRVTSLRLMGMLPVFSGLSICDYPFGIL
jgi:hypothetical protein